MPYTLYLEAEQSRPYDIGGERVGARDDDPGLDGNSTGGTGRNHRGMADRNSQMNGKSFRHRGDERVHVVEEGVLMLFRGSRMTVVVRGGKRHRDVLERECHRRGAMQFQLTDHDQRLVIEHA
jgi:hypothetical protein